MGDAKRTDGAVAERACEWVARWLQREACEWDGPPQVVLFARRIVIALGATGPITVNATAGFRFRLRIAPNETPAASLDDEPDDGSVDVAPALFVPPSLGRVGEGRT